MADWPAGCVDLVLTDPPYYKVKGQAWDRQWDDPAAFLAWLGRVAGQWHRLLKPNGSLYCFASPQMAARVEVEISKQFNVLNRIVWAKADGAGNGQWKKQNPDGWLRAFFPQTEYLIFAEHYGADQAALGQAGYGAKCDELRGFVFEPLRAYLDGERQRAGVSRAQCNGACGFAPTPGAMASRHYFSASQWCLPTREHYEALQGLFNSGTGGPYLRREYEDLRREYEDLRRPFRVTAAVPYTDVWTFATVAAYPGKHPCQKPLAMMEHIIDVSTRPGALVLDSFCGAGTTCVAAKGRGRRWIGIEQSADYAAGARYRLAEAETGVPVAEARVGQIGLFEKGVS